MRVGPSHPFSQRLHQHKYRAAGETFEGAMARIAGALEDDPAKRYLLCEALLSMRLLPAGRVQSAVGSPRSVTPYNCFVSGRLEDSFVEGSGSIMDRAREAAATMRMGGGIGYDFSTLRPRGALISKLGSQSSGPVAFMDIFDAICRCTSSAGNRRGAQMGVLRVDHPDILEFVSAKQNGDRLTGFNISVAVTDEFMSAVRGAELFPLRWGGRVWGMAYAPQLWDAIMESTYKWSEPGVLFIDRINRLNRLSYCEEIAATNPCGEQPLPPHGACLLASINLPAYAWGGAFQWGLLRADVASAVRALDRVPDIASFPLPQQLHEARAKRRMGLGITGLANAGELLAGPYGSPAFLDFEAHVLDAVRDSAYEASALLAAERGSFPAFHREDYLDRATDLPPRIRDLIASNGLRNSHLLSIAPAGTISLCADNASSGIEPVFAHSARRRVHMDGGVEEVELTDLAVTRWGLRGRTAAEVSPEEHLQVLAVAQARVDSSVSKTINLPADCSWEEFKGVYMRAWELGCKGCTTYRPGARAAVLEPSSCSLDPVTGRVDCQ